MMKFFLFLFFISSSVFATISTSTDSVASKTDTYPATGNAATAASVVPATASGTKFIYTYRSVDYSNSSSACSAIVAYNTSLDGHPYSLSSQYSSGNKFYCYMKWSGGAAEDYSVRSSVTNYVCASGTESDSSGKASITGAYCSIPATPATYTCNSGDRLDGSTCIHDSCDTGYTLSSDGLLCTKQVTEDSCSSLAGQKYYAWSTKGSDAPICQDGCIANHFVSTYGDASVYQLGTYKYTGVSCSDTGTYQATVSADDAKKADDAALQTAIDEQKKACGSAGYDQGTSNGKTVIACKVPDTKTTKTSTTTNTDGSTDTTTETTTTTGATGTTCSYDTSTYDVSCTGGTSGTSSTTSSTKSSSSSSTTNPDGSTTTTDTTTEEGEDDSGSASTDASDFDYKDTKRETRTMTDIFQSHYDDLKSTQVFSSVSSFFNLSISSGSCSAWVFPFFDASISFDPCSFVEYLCAFMRVAVLIVCSFFAFRTAVDD